MSGQKVLVLGGTGAMGTYLVPKLIEMGYLVDVVALDGMNSNNPDFSTFRQIPGRHWLREQLKTDTYHCRFYDTQQRFLRRYQLLLDNTSHYIFFSTYRVYAKACLSKKPPRLLDISKDEAFLATAAREYSLYKAMQEDILTRSKYGGGPLCACNHYSKRRFQLITLEANVVVNRAMKGLPVVLPREALPIWGTMSWAGDVATMLSRLVLNPAAFKETYTLSTAEHHTWQEIADYYKEIIGLTYVTVDTDTYVRLLGGRRCKVSAPI